MRLPSRFPSAGVRRGGCAALSWLVVTAGCGSDHLSGPDASGRAASLRTTAGDTLTGPAGRPLATDIVFLVADSAGDPLARVRVTVAPDSASGSVDAAQTFTDTTGTARVEGPVIRR